MGDTTVRSALTKVTVKDDLCVRVYFDRPDYAVRAITAIARQTVRALLSQSVRTAHFPAPSLSLSMRGLRSVPPPADPLYSGKP